MDMILRREDATNCATLTCQEKERLNKEIQKAYDVYQKKIEQRNIMFSLLNKYKEISYHIWGSLLGYMEYNPYSEEQIYNMCEKTIEEEKKS
jgi:hypothetical protein